MSFHNELFPTDISYGSRGGPGFKTTVVTLPSGAEQRVQMWEGGRGQYDVAYGIKTVAQIATLQKFFRARRGAAYAFLYKDFLDFHSDPSNPSYVTDEGLEGHGPGDSDQDIGVGDGTETLFQLIKTYTSGGYSITRNIFKPVSGTVRIWVNAVELTEGVGFTVNYSTGQITLASAPTIGHIVSASFEFYVVVRFSEEASEVLSASIDGFDMGSIPSIPLIEILDINGGYESEFLYGGSEDIIMTANMSISLGVFMQRISTDTSSLYVSLPDPTLGPDGRPVLCIVNSGDVAFDVKDFGGTTLVNIDRGESALLSIVYTSSGTKGWVAL